MKVLNIVERAYRATLEERDDAIVWLAPAMKAAGGDLTVLLCGNAVNYAVRGQDGAGLGFGTWRQTQLPRLTDDIAALVAKGLTVYVLAEDLMQRGLEGHELFPGLERVSRESLPSLFAVHDQIWHW